YAVMLKREHEEINWELTRKKIYDQIRGLNPWPGAYTLFRGEIVKIWKSSLKGYSFETGKDEWSTEKYSPGQIIQLSSEGIFVQAGDAPLLISQVQPAGKRPMPARDFFLGRHGITGEYFGK
ncbi:MAG: methionyl-tRNA formyltransferase, partial [Desulfitobacterium hafniense]|nr:methionyl-tRNA formyltransferase [Desulfitobacterium hafniense]